MLKKHQCRRKSEQTNLPGLHLLRAPSEGHVRVSGTGAVPSLLLYGRDQRVGFAVFPLSAPVIEDLLDELVVLLQQQLGFRKTHKLKGKKTKQEVCFR